MAQPHRLHEYATIEMFRRDPELATEYLNSVLHDGDKTDLEIALRSINMAFGGIDEIGKGRSLGPAELLEKLTAARDDVPPS